MGEDTRRIGTPVHFQWLLGIVQMVIVLNVLDAILTILWVYSGKATEANPLMAGLIDKFSYGRINGVWSSAAINSGWTR